MKGFKAFNKDMTCQGFQFEENKTYEEKKAKICQSGFHFCKNPFDVLDYYDLCESEFTEVEAIGTIDTQKNGDSKHTTTKIKIGVKLGLGGFIKSTVNFLIDFCKKDNKPDKKDYSQLAASGYSSKLAASGYYSQLAASGYYSQLAA
ncbi:MAG: hypothetical protein HN597_14875, partial [Desulfobacula sp.]|uniref:DUF7666 domain-containing protein n=1 Tax=Desulfobacula sp. TaxID=2593537 RepID=UPI0039B8EFF2|nr:hypothetical protein [Desulfobacula sp.]